MSDELPPEAGKAILVYELCCGICGGFANSKRPLGQYAIHVGFVRVLDFGYVHEACLEGEPTS